MYQHVKYVSNQVLLQVKRHGFEKEAMVKCGKLLWRLFVVFQAYNAKKRDLTLKEVVNIVQQFRKIVTG